MTIRERIKKLTIDRNAIILAHYYQPDYIQEIADRVGDSLELCKAARDSDADIIVFCGVDFMADSAKLLSPNKTVLLPCREATCPMANMINIEDINKLRVEHPDAEVVTYINSTIECKTVTDICCTSSNAVNIVNSLSCDKIIFLPDKNLGKYISKRVDKEVILWGGYCCVHNNITLEKAQQAKLNHPNALLVVHPECRDEVVEIADFCGSTAKIIDYVTNSSAEEFIIGTEEGILYELRRRNKGKVFHMVAPNVICHNMKKITLEDIIISLENNYYSVQLDQETIVKASKPLDRMMKLSV